MKTINLKSEIFANKELIQLGDRHTLLFVKILFLSDKNGKFDFGRLFEGERELAKALEEKGLIISYEAGNTTIGIIKKRSLFIKDCNENLTVKPNSIGTLSDEANYLTSNSDNGLQILKKSSEKFPFEEWFEMYGKETGEVIAKKYWNLLNLSDRKLVFEHTRKYVEFNPDWHYRLDPAKYLKQEKFRDKVVIDNRHYGNNSTTKRERNTEELSSLAERSAQFLNKLAG